MLVNNMPCGSAVILTAREAKAILKALTLFDLETMQPGKDVAKACIDFDGEHMHLVVLPPEAIGQCGGCGAETVVTMFHPLGKELCVKCAEVVTSVPMYAAPGSTL